MAKDQTPKKNGAPDPETREEARHLAEEAMEEMERGNEEEAKFVLNEARALDKDAVEDVLEEQKKGAS